MSESFDPSTMIERFKARATAVKKRNLPPVGGDERDLFIRQAEEDYLDFSMLADAKTELTDGVLTLTIDLN